MTWHLWRTAARALSLEFAQGEKETPIQTAGDLREGPSECTLVGVWGPRLGTTASP